MVQNLEDMTINSTDYNVTNSSCDEDNCTTVDPQTTIIIENTERTTLNTTEIPNVTTTISPQNDTKSPVSNTTKKKHSLFRRKSSCDCDLMDQYCDLNCCCDSECSEEHFNLFSKCMEPVSNQKSRLNYCTTENWIWKNNTESKIEITSNGLFCIYKDNLPPTVFYGQSYKINSPKEILDLTNRNNKWVRKGLEQIPNDIQIMLKDKYRHGSSILCVENGTINFLENNTVIDYSIMRSGNPGYLQGYPILIGELKSYALLNETYLPEFEKFIKICMKIQEQIWEIWTIYNTTAKTFKYNKYFGVYGNANRSNLNEWKTVLYDNTPLLTQQNTDSGEIKCFSLVTTLQIEILYERIPQKMDTKRSVKILAIYYNFLTTEDYEMKQIKSGGNIHIELKSNVMFYDLTNYHYDQLKFASAPTFDLHLPNDFFYPFLLNSGHRIFTNQIFIIYYLAIACSIPNIHKNYFCTTKLIE
ncbi:uncharacterized protein LOC123292720 [Chrysoperla carnea]|uniref:uncharacterized protein LOC123292720 n=1 Tax=Chrysoperla carnea TaxID=189513 RepID=UPI001D07672F|nr:uncharacterized protein LOC123292720 [Chrysoperla carnea]